MKAGCQTWRAQVWHPDEGFLSYGNCELKR